MCVLGPERGERVNMDCFSDSFTGSFPSIVPVSEGVLILPVASCLLQMTIHVPQGLRAFPRLITPAHMLINIIRHPRQFIRNCSLHHFRDTPMSRCVIQTLRETDSKDSLHTVTFSESTANYPAGIKLPVKTKQYGVLAQRGHRAVCFCGVGGCHIN